MTEKTHSDPSRSKKETDSSTLYTNTLFCSLCNGKPYSTVLLEGQKNKTVTLLWLMCLQVTDKSAVIELVCVDVPTLLCSVVFSIPFIPFSHHLLLSPFKTQDSQGKVWWSCSFQKLPTETHPLLQVSSHFSGKKGVLCGLFNIAGSGRNSFSCKLTLRVSPFWDFGYWKNSSAVTENDPLDSLKTQWENLTEAGKRLDFSSSL